MYPLYFGTNESVYHLCICCVPSCQDCRNSFDFLICVNLYCPVFIILSLSSSLLFAWCYFFIDGVVPFVLVYMVRYCRAKPLEKTNWMLLCNFQILEWPHSFLQMRNKYRHRLQNLFQEQMFGNALKGAVSQDQCMVQKEGKRFIT